MSKSERLRNLNKRVSTEQKKSSFQWRPFLALLGVYIIFLFDQQWAWGILFLYWVIPDIIRGVTYFIEPVEKENSPFLYWAIVLSWILMSLLSLSTLFIDYTQYT